MLSPIVEKAKVSVKASATLIFLTEKTTLLIFALYPLVVTLHVGRFVAN